VEPDTLPPVLVFALALFMGALCTDLFYRFWKGVLGVGATAHLSFSGRIPRQVLMQRLTLHSLRAVCCCAGLVLVSRLYLVRWDMGHTEFEQLAFFLGCAGRMLPLVFVLKQEIESLFDPE
jgi:hypothetical protein